MIFLEEFTGGLDVFGALGKSWGISGKNCISHKI